MTVFEMAKMYYPTLWDIKRLDVLLADKITKDEYDELMALLKEVAYSITGGSNLTRNILIISQNRKEYTYQC